MNPQQAAYGAMRGASEALLRSLGGAAKLQEVTDVSRLLARPHEYAAGSMEFGGETITGSVLFLSDFQFFASRLPSRKRATSLDRPSARDWFRVRDLCMELTNQLLGRITNQLYRVGIIVEHSLPVAISGPAIRVVVSARKEAPSVYAADGREVFVWFEVTAKEGVVGPPGPMLLREGDFIKF
jgi:hypothetical protein